jgi:glyoxylase-like metal-dependent hydrolase (beta-lactamase superfamily II)
MTARAVADGIWAVTAGSFPSNSYVCAADVPGGAILIDTGLDPEPIDAALQSLGLRPAFVFCTHGHFDHIGSAAFFQRKYGAPVHLHAADAKTAGIGNFLLTAMKLPDRIVLPELTLVDGAFSVQLGERSLRYLHLPGHTPGSCAIAFSDQLFTGDTLYARGVGLSKLPGERPEQLRRSITELWEHLPGFHVHPGHGPSATGADIQRNNTRLLAFLGLPHSEKQHRPCLS